MGGMARPGSAKHVHLLAATHRSPLPLQEEDDEEQPPPAKRQCGTAEPPAGPEERDSVEAGSGRQQATAAAAAPYQQESPLALLSEPLLLRVLAKLSPEDLLIVAQTCRHFRAAASDASLWRRLYYARCVGSLLLEAAGGSPATCAMLPCGL